MCFDNKPDDIKVYRGQTNPWPITPTLWRNGYKRRNLDHFEIIKSYILPESITTPHPTYEFFDSFLSTEGFAGLGQHHGFPTTLVDITFHPLVALYFSSRNSQKHQFSQSQLTGHGVIFEGTYRNLEILSNRSKISIDYSLLPPMQVPRLYQQQGLFVDCHKLDCLNDLSELELAFQRIYFPREYPDMTDAQEVFSDEMIIRHLEFNTPGMLSPQANYAEKDWYLSLFGYSEVLKDLNKIINANEKINKGTVLEQIRNKYIKNPLPWHFHRKHFDTVYSKAMAYAETHSKVAEFMIRVARIHTTEGPKLNENVIESYAQNNKMLFEAFLTSSATLDILSLKEFSYEIKSLRKIEEIVKGSLSYEQKNELENLIPHTGMNS